VAPALLTAPTVDGTPTVGRPVTATPSSWVATPAPSFAYRWLRCTAAAGKCIDITGATSGTYTPVRRDTGSQLRIHVTATNPFGSAEATSAPSAPVTCRRLSHRARRHTRPAPMAAPAGHRVEPDTFDAGRGRHVDRRSRCRR